MPAYSCIGNNFILVCIHIYLYNNSPQFVNNRNFPLPFTVAIPFSEQLHLSLNGSAGTRVYASKWTFLVYQLQMGKFWSILGTRTNLIAGKYSTFNGENDDVFGLWSKTYFWRTYNRFKMDVQC